MNKDEMIEKMAKVLCDNDKRCDECISRLLLPCGYKSYCTKLYNAGYRKVGKGEIVIKKSEYEELRLAKHKQTAYQQFEQAKQETEREFLITIYDNLKYATIKQTGTLMSIKSLAKEKGIELE